MENNLNSLKARIHELDIEYRKVPKRKWRFRIVALFFILLSVSLILIISSRRNAAIKRVREEYLGETDITKLDNLYEQETLRGDSKALSWFEENALGIPNNNALAGLSWNCEGNINYKNQIKDTVAYQDIERKVLVIEVAGQQVYESEHRVGEIIATQKNVYYIDKDDGDKLRVFNVETAEDNEIAPDVNRFAVYGDTIFFLDKKETICRYSIKDNHFSEVVGNIQRFFLSGSIIAQKDRYILQVSLDGSGYKEIAENALVIGADKDNIYYTNFGSTALNLATELSEDHPITGENEDDLDKENIICALDMSSKEITIVDSRNSLPRAVYHTDEGIMIDTIE